MIDAAKSNQDWNTEAEKNAVLEMLDVCPESLCADGEMIRNIS